MKTAPLLSRDMLLAATEGTVIGESCIDFVCTSVVTDSRAVKAGSLFVPLVGTQQDGHVYIPDALTHGARAVFVADAEYRRNIARYTAMAQQHPAVLFIRVGHTLTALQRAARAYVAQFPTVQVIGITGSSGKKTTKELLAHILRQTYAVVANEGNLNSETGVPLSAFHITGAHEIGIFELGMNRAHEIEETAAIVRPTIGVVTNIGTAHIGQLGSVQAIAAEKKHVFDYTAKTGAAFIPAAGSCSDFLAAGVGGHVYYFGRTVPTEKSGVALVADNGFAGTVFTVDGTVIRLPLPGRHNYDNALAAVAVARYMGVSPECIKRGLESFSPLPGRSELIRISLRTGATVTVLKDCYNANPDSMACALQLCAEDQRVTQKIFVLGDMGELGAAAQSAHEAVGIHVAKINPALTFFLGDEMQCAAQAASDRGYTRGVSFPCIDDETVIQTAAAIAAATRDGAMILVKGSRSGALERIVTELVDSWGGKNG